MSNLDKHFIFNGMCTDEYNLICGFVGGKIDDYFSAGSQTDLQTESNFNGSVYHIISNKYSEPINFNLELVHKDGGKLSREEVRSIIKWLCNPIDYMPLQIKDTFYENIVYYVKFTNPEKISINGVNGIRVKCTSKYPYGLTNLIKKKYVLNSSILSFTIPVNSDENDYIYPEFFKITFNSNCNLFTLKNLNDIEDSQIEVKNIENGESFNFKCQDKFIETLSTNPLERFNKKWPRFLNGKNEFVANSTCVIEVGFREIRKVGLR